MQSAQSEEGNFSISENNAPFATLQVSNTILLEERMTSTHGGTDSVDAEPVLNSYIGVVEGQEVRVTSFQL